MPANYGKRALAFIIDFCCAAGLGLAVGFTGLLFLIPDLTRKLGIIVLILSPIVVFLFEIWNKIIRQGSTGQTLGKQSQKIRIINTDTGETPGIGWIFMRELLFWIFNTMTGGLFLIVDYLFPVWDPQGRRILDRMMKTQVIETVQSAYMTKTTSHEFAPPTAV
jgi:uncharacterized RDD family membrane protein YckC